MGLRLLHEKGIHANPVLGAKFQDEVRHCIRKECLVDIPEKP